MRLDIVLTPLHEPRLPASWKRLKESPSSPGTPALPLRPWFQEDMSHPGSRWTLDAAGPHSTGGLAEREQAPGWGLLGRWFSNLSSLRIPSARST